MPADPIVPHSTHRVLEHLETVQGVALQASVTASPESSVYEAEQRMVSCAASELYVIDDGGRLLGIVPDYEFLNDRLLGGDGQRQVTALMVPVTASITLQTQLEDAARILTSHRHGSLPVLEGQRLIGELCRTHLLRILLERGDDFASPPLNQTSAPVPPPKFSHLLQALGNTRLFSR